MSDRQALVAFVTTILLANASSGVRADYQDEVLADAPVAYWRLGEDDVFLPAENLGSELVALDGTYVGDVVLEDDPLIVDDSDTAVGFNGFDAQIQIPDSDRVNTGGPFPSKTIELWFQAELIDTEPRVVWEEGGSNNGLTVYVHEDQGEFRLFMMARASNLDLGVVSTEIDEGVAYHAVMVLDVTNDEDGDGTLDGRISGYLDGQEFDTVSDIGVQLGNHGGNCAIGGVNGRAPLAGATAESGTGFFLGTIDEVALYDYALDDPDGDGDTVDSRVADHFTAGTGIEVTCPTQLVATREAGGIKLSWDPGGAETSVRVVRDGVELAAAAPVDPPEYIDTTAAPGALSYELTFDGGGACSLSERIDVCISDLGATATLGRVDLSWANNFDYTGVVVRRGDDVLATLAGDQTVYADLDPPAGLWTYSVAPENGACEPTTFDIWVFDTEYPNLVIADGAGGYWRLGENAGEVTATNFGTLGSEVDGTYVGNVLLEEDSLLIREPGDPAVRFDGVDAQVNLPDSAFINLAGPFLAKTVELWFQAELIGPAPQILWEEGGNDDGLNIYVQEVDGDFLLFMVAWAEGGPTWGPAVVTAEIEEGRAYHAVMVFDASFDEDLDTLDGRVTGYLDGEEFETWEGAGPLDRHGSNVAIGGISGATQFADGTQQGSGANFIGIIDDVSVYRIALDDPNGDEDRSDSRVLAHFEAGADPGDCPSVLEVARDGDNVKLTWKSGIGETSVRVLRNGVEVAAAAPVDPPEYIDTTATPDRLEYRLEFDLAECQPLRRVYKACLSDLTAVSRIEGVELTWNNNLRYAGITIERDDGFVASIDGDQESYLDADPPSGLRTYSVVASEGSCDPVTVEVHVFDTAYPYAVVGDGAFAYWRLSEEGDIALVPATNYGRSGAQLDGSYLGGIQLGEGSLVADAPDDPAIRLEGFDGLVAIPDSTLINVTGPFEAKTIELWFAADTIDSEPRVLWEEGGGTNGLGIFVQEVDGTPLLIMTARSDATGWGPLAVSTEIEAGVVYHAVMVLDGSEDEEVGNFDGRITGYLDGEEFETVTGADVLAAHTGDTGIGGLNGVMSLPDGTPLDFGGGFAGTIDDVSLYEIALDDPDGDADPADSRVRAHFLIGSGETTPGRPRFRRGDPGDVGMVNISSAIFILSFLFDESVTVLPCLEAGDINNDGAVNITDPVNLLGHLFGPQPPPAPPGLECGEDPDDPGSPGDLGCETYTSC